MFLIFVASFFISLVIWLYFRWSQVQQYWAKRNVQFMPPHPILGSLGLMFTGSSVDWMMDLYKKSNGAPYIGAWLFWRPVLVINSPELAQKVLIKNFDVFKNRFSTSAKSEPIGSLNLFFVQDPLWTNIRRHLSPVFTSAKLRLVQTLLMQKSTELIQRIRMEKEKNNPINLKLVLTDCTTDIVGGASFGIESDATLTGDSVIRKMTKDMERFDFGRAVAWLGIFFFPEVVDILGLTFFSKAATRNFSRIFREAVSLRGGYEKEPREITDLLDALIKMKYDADKNNEEMIEDVLIAQAAVFVMGGFEAPSLTLTFTLYELAFNPHVQEKLYNELNEAKQIYGDKMYEMKTMSELKYLNCVIKETLRKYPNLPFMDRVANQDFKIDENLTIRKGTPVLVNVVGMQRDEKLCKDPMKFDPDRFLYEDNEHKIVYLPFGDGPRHCIGMRFGYMIMFYLLASLCLNFEVRPLPGFPVPSEVKFMKPKAVITPAQTLSVEFIPRNTE